MRQNPACTRSSQSGRKELQSRGGLDQIQEEIITGKALDFLLTNATVVEVPKPTEPEPEPAAAEAPAAEPEPAA